MHDDGVIFVCFAIPMVILENHVLTLFSNKIIRFRDKYKDKYLYACTSRTFYGYKILIVNVKYKETTALHDVTRVTTTKNQSKNLAKYISYYLQSLTI